MRPERPINSKLDEIGRRIVIAASPCGTEVDRIVSGPLLFDGVMAKIAAEKAQARPRPRGFAWKPVAVSAMVLALLSVPMLAYLKFIGASDPVAVRPRPAQISPPAKQVVPVPVPETAEPVDEPKFTPAREVIVSRVEAPADVSPRTRKRRPVVQPRPEPAFQAIGLQERAEDAAIDGRVVRVDVPRATLFAMGVDLPLENGTHSVKADLLLGPDGLPRAIRLVE